MRATLKLIRRWLLVWTVPQMFLLNEELVAFLSTFYLFNDIVLLIYCFIDLLFYCYQSITCKGLKLFNIKRIWCLLMNAFSLRQIEIIITKWNKWIYLLILQVISFLHMVFCSVSRLYSSQYWQTHRKNILSFCRFF